MDRFSLSSALYPCFRRFVLNILRLNRRVFSLFLPLCLILTLMAPARTLAAPAWPSEIAIQAEGGILMDADSGCVIFGQNIHQQFFPASITKILTALIIVERCDLDDTITFSHNAVYNVERGSTSAGYDTGDQITVREALYAMLLKSANEVANALAEHCAGSIEEFAVLMNEKAAELGCKDSHFANPSGLNDPNHYTTAYDFALISKAAFENPVFVEFDSTTYHEMGPNATNKEPFTVYCGHKMMKKNSGMYYPGILGGKTGYTTLAGNTLVTCVERDGLKLITVVLNGHQTHYTDTQAMMDFGFANFKNVNISDYETSYTSPESDISLTGNHSSLLQLDTGRSVTLPKNAEFSDASTELSYELTDRDPGNAAARLTYLYNDRVIGTTWLLASQDDVSIAPDAVPGTAGSGEPALHEKLLETISTPDVFQKVLIGLIVLLIIAAAAALVLLAKHILYDSSRDDIRFSESMRRLQEQSSALNQESIYRDSSSSVDHYLPDTRLNSRSKSSRWFKRKG